LKKGVITIGGGGASEKGGEKKGPLPIVFLRKKKRNAGQIPLEKGKRLLGRGGNWPEQTGNGMRRSNSDARQGERKAFSELLGMEGTLAEGGGKKSSLHPEVNRGKRVEGFEKKLSGASKGGGDQPGGGGKGGFGPCVEWTTTLGEKKEDSIQLKKKGNFTKVFGGQGLPWKGGSNNKKGGLAKGRMQAKNYVNTKPVVIA